MATMETALALIDTRGDLLLPDSPYQLQRAAIKGEMIQVLQRSKLITEITDAETYQHAIDAGRVLQAGQGKAAEFFKPIKRQFDERKQVVLDNEKEDVGAIETEKRRIAALVDAWDAAQAQIRRAEQQRQQEQQRKDEIERRLAEAIHLKESGASEEVVEERLAEESMPIAIVQPHVTPMKTAGKTTRETWTAVVDDKKALIRAIAEGKADAGAVEINQSFLNKLASAFHEGLSIPGVRAVSSKATSFRGR